MGTRNVGGEALARRPLDTAPLGSPPRRMGICGRQVDLVRRCVGRWHVAPSAIWTGNVYP